MKPISATCALQPLWRSRRFIARKESRAAAWPAPRQARTPRGQLLSSKPACCPLVSEW
ncbi:hypothetical protein RGE_26810 [Rubrivivax gelatinosus IL144]|uniref:Uncharacterized protein n=1 Tax=Rubrivivax gelatinosus (strain NBRC 100245 / IL144) TaxID=983917 RepID=I0HSN3_RUBGI|nr:hypothetical protein RGE_26810 [Rubrivivax gelatinosus IL144]